MAKRKQQPQRIGGMRAVLYLRLSPKRQEGAASIEKQRHNCKEIAKRLGATVIGEFVESDSAWDRDDPRDREKYGRMLDMVVAGEVDIVIAYDSDRMWRDDVERGLFMRDARVGGLWKVVSPSNEIDPHNANDDYISGMLTLAAKKSSADTSRRVRDENKMKRARGEITRPVNALGRRGARHAEGRDPNNALALHEGEAALMRDAARRILAGESAGSIAREWMAKGVPKPENAERAVREGLPIPDGVWMGSEVMNTLTRPWVTGLQAHRGEVIGELTNCPKILDRKTWEALVARSARQSQRPRAVLRTPWSGVFRCAGVIRRGGVEVPCGANLHHGVSNRGTRRYTCTAKGCCGGVTIKAEFVEELAVKLIVEYVDGADGERLRARLRDAKVDVDSTLDRLLEMRAKSEDLDRRNVVGELSDERHARMTKMIDVEIEELERELQNAKVLPAEVVKYLGNGKLLKVALESGELSPDRQRGVFFATNHYVWVEPRDQARQPHGCKVIDVTRISFDPEHPAKRGKRRKK